MSVSYFKTSAQSAFTGVAVTVGPVEWLTAFEGQNDRVYFRQQYQQDIDSWTPLALDTTHPTATTYLLVRESDIQNIGGGQQKWYRYFACTPPQRVEYTTIAAQFPGYDLIRDPINASSTTKLTYDYFLINSPSDIPTLSDASVVTFPSGEVAPLLSGVQLTISTNPTISSYSAKVTGDRDTYSQFSITAEAQSLARWSGNFYERKTVQVKAK